MVSVGGDDTTIPDAPGSAVFTGVLSLFTVIVVKPTIGPVVEVAVMFAVPGLTAITLPVAASTVATEVLLDFQVTWVTVALVGLIRVRICTVLPMLVVGRAGTTVIVFTGVFVSPPRASW